MTLAGKKKMPAKETEKSPPLSSSGRRYGRRLGDQPTTGAWMLTFTDIMALMLTFFVLLYAMSNPRPEDWKGLTDTIQQNFNKYYGQAQNRGFQETISIDKIDFSRALDLSYLRALIRSLIEREGSLQSVALINQRGSLIISMPQDLLFEAAQADVKPEGTKALYAIAEMLSRIKNRVEIVGHTDPRPLTSSEFAGNWDLSIARAARVAAVLQDVGYSQPVTVRGMAAGRYADLPEALPEEQRLDISRRVDIVIMEDDGKRVKLFDIGLP
jgi:chemotaxis protein MotB